MSEKLVSLGKAEKNHSAFMKEVEHQEMLDLEAQYCSYGDTVHYVDPPKRFAASAGGFLYDDEGKSYFDLQMQYSAANLGYKNSRLNRVLKDQLQTLPQLDGKYLDEQRCLLGEKLSLLTEQRFGMKGRVHFSGGGGRDRRLSAVDSESNRKKLSLCFHGWVSRQDTRCVGHHVQLPLPPALRPLRRPCPFHPVSLLFPLLLRPQT